MSNNIKLLPYLHTDVTDVTDKTNATDVTDVTDVAIKNTEGFSKIQVDNNDFCKPVTHNHKWSIGLLIEYRFLNIWSKLKIFQILVKLKIFENLLKLKIFEKFMKIEDFWKFS